MNILFCFRYISTTSKFCSLFATFTSRRTNQLVWPFNILLLLSVFFGYSYYHVQKNRIIFLPLRLWSMHAGINWPTWVDHGILHYYKTSAKTNKFYSSFKYCCLWWLVPQKPHSPCTLEPQIYFLNFSPSNLKKTSGWSLQHKRDAFRLCPIFSTVLLSATPF